MTKILIPSETSSGERRVSATPEAVKKLKSLGCDVYIESWCGGYDTDTFNSMEMCCICGGGSTGDTPGSMSDAKFAKDWSKAA